MSESESEYTSESEDNSDIELVEEHEIQPYTPPPPVDDEAAKQKAEQRRQNLRDNLVKARAKAQENKELKKLKAAHALVNRDMDELDDSDPDEKEVQEEPKPKVKKGLKPRCQHRFLKGVNIGEFCRSFAVVNNRCNKHNKIKHPAQPGVFWTPKIRKENGDGVPDEDEVEAPAPRQRKLSKAESKKLLKEQHITMLADRIAKQVTAMKKKRPVKEKKEVKEESKKEEEPKKEEPKKEEAKLPTIKEEPDHPASSSRSSSSKKKKKSSFFDALPQQSTPLPPKRESPWGPSPTLNF
jgi:hypothetical protein